MKRLSSLGLAALLTAAALTSCQKELETELLAESESEPEAVYDGTRSTYTTSSSYLKLEETNYIANPEKGLYKHYDIYFDQSLADKYPNAIEVKSDGRGYPKVSNYTFGFQEGTLVLLQFYLIDFRTSNLNSEALSRIRSIIGNVRTAKKKAIVRFSYSREHGSDLTYDSSSPRDASYSQVLNHIGQLKSILQDNEDIIYLLQGGFIGTYGEWYYISVPEYVYDDSSVNSNGFHNRKEIITQMLNAVPNRMVALRTPKFKRLYLNCKSEYNGYSMNSYESLPYPNANGDAHSRLAFYNDVFMHDRYDMQGTYPSSIDKDMWFAQSKCLACGGETANNRSTEDYMYDEDPVTWIRNYHMSYLNRRISATVAENGNVTYSSRLYYKWAEEGKEPAIANALGYRLWMNKFQMSGSYSTGQNSTQNATITFSLRNEGAAPVIYKRPMKLVLMRNNQVIQELASTTGSCLIDGAYNYIWFTTGNANTTAHGSSIDNDLADLRKIPSVTDNNPYRYMTCQVRFPKNLQSGDCIALWMPDQSSNLRSTPEYSIRLCNQELGNIEWKNGYNVLYKFQ